MTQTNRPPIADLSRQTWDLIIIGGGITGAAVLREAAGLGLQALLVERDDFASGTSSHSAKLVHGGLHYLSRFQLGLAHESIRERDLLMRERPGLVEPIDFILPVAFGDRRHAYVTSVGLSVYQAMSGSLHRAPHLGRDALDRLAPGLDNRFEYALRYVEGQTDDARLTLRVLADAEKHGGTALNYAEATELLRDRHGQITGVELGDRVNGETACLPARYIVNATGPWSDTVRARAGLAPRQRIVRGSHLVFPRDRFPLQSGMAVYHPVSGLPLYLVPWRGVTIAGTTHIETSKDIDQPASTTADEVEYLLAGVRELFPDARLGVDDIQATFSGYRPIVDTHAADPARASRDAGIWLEDGLITATGGKLTTHRSMARQVMRRIAPKLSRLSGSRNGKDPGFTQFHAERLPTHPQSDLARLAAHYGSDSLGFFTEQGEDACRSIPELGDISLAELRWSTRREHVVHLDDLLARRARVALLAPEGGVDQLGRIEPIVRQELGWDAAQWRAETERYLTSWQERYAVAMPAPPRMEQPVIELRRTG